MSGLRSLPGALPSAWGRLGLRGQLVVLNAAVIGITIATVLILMHDMAAPSFMSIVHAAGVPLNASAGQRAYEDAVASQLYPPLAIAAAVGLILNVVVVSLALRPLQAVRAATRSLAEGGEPAPIETRRRDAIGGVAESVNDLARSLRRLDDLRRQLTNDVAHELRTPLHNLLGLLEGMRDGVIPATPEQIGRAEHELARLIALVEDLRALSDAQLARDRMERKALHLVPVVRETMDTFAAVMAGRAISGSVEVDGCDPVVLGDRQRLSQVVANVVANAVRHAAPDTTVVARLALAGSGAVRVSVTDRGDVIPPEALPYLFERFFRVDASRARQSGGAGIGLAIVRELVDAHGGRVGAVADEGGATIWFELPVAVAGSAV